MSWAGNERGVSSVIGVVLMVSVAVLVASVVGIFVFDLGGSLTDPAPQASWTIEYEADSGPGWSGSKPWHSDCQDFESPNCRQETGSINEGEDGDKVTIVLNSGDTIPVEELVIRVGNEETRLSDSSLWVTSKPSGKVEGGNRIVLQEQQSATADCADGGTGNVCAFESGETVQIIWDPTDTDRSSLLVESEVPDDD